VEGSATANASPGDISPHAEKQRGEINSLGWVKINADINRIELGAKCFGLDVGSNGQHVKIFSKFRYVKMFSMSEVISFQCCWLVLACTGKPIQHSFFGVMKQPIKAGSVLTVRSSFVLEGPTQF
jgi:hypothetical protein